MLTCYYVHILVLVVVQVYGTYTCNIDLPVATMLSDISWVLFLLTEIHAIESKFDVKYCRNWVDHDILSQKEVSAINQWCINTLFVEIRLSFYNISNYFYHESAAICIIMRMSFAHQMTSVYSWKSGSKH